VKEKRKMEEEEEEMKNAIKLDVGICIELHGKRGERRDMTPQDTRTQHFGNLGNVSRTHIKMNSPSMLSLNTKM
jgi:hypothetical protein